MAQKLGMTRGEMLVKMSSWELTHHMALSRIHNREQEQANRRNR